MAQDPRSLLLEGRATGPLDVIKGINDIRQGGLYGISRSIQPVMEARAIRPWELVLEGIRPWGRRNGQAAVLAEFGMVAVGLAAGLPKGSVLVVDRIRAEPTAAGPLLFVSTRAVMEATLATAVTTVPLDGRLGLSTDPAVEILAGSDPANQGTQLAKLDLTVPGAQWDYPITVGYQKDGLAGASDLFVVVEGSVVNQLITVEFAGKVIVPRS